MSVLGIRAASLAVLLVGFGSAHAAPVPPTMDQQGRFLKSDGAPEVGNLGVTFALYDAATGGAALWSELQTLTLDSAGFYAAALGGTTPFPKALFDGRSLFLGITITGEMEMAPRQPLHSVPYALRAAEAVDAVGDIHPTSVTVGGKMVIDKDGNIVGGGGMIGPVGPTGPAGPVGMKGDAGAKGDPGMVGPQGTQGPTGMGGAVGGAGPAGMNGKDGKDGGGSGIITLDLELDEMGGVDFADTSGLGNKATGSPGGLAAGSIGHSGKAVSFSGGVITVAAPTKIPDSPQVWVEAWVMPLGAVNTTRTIATKVGSYSLKQVNQNIQFSVLGTGSMVPCVALSAGNAVTNAGKWFHVAGWYDGLNATVSIDGTVRATAYCPNGPVMPTPNNAFHVGGIPAGNNVTEDYSGRIDEVRVRQVAAQNYTINNFRKLQRTVDQCNDGADSGYLTCRKLTFVKTRDDTLVHFIWSDNRRGIGYIYGYWDVMWNRKECVSPKQNRYHHHSVASNNYNDNHYNATITGVCGATEAGPMLAGTYDIEIRLTHRGGNNSDWYVGWDNTTFMIEAEEVY